MYHEKSSPVSEILNAMNSARRAAAHALPEDRLKNLDYLQQIFLLQQQVVLMKHLVHMRMASNKVVYELLVRLEKLHSEGSDIHIDWIYETYDEDMFDEGSGYKDCLSIPIELIERPSE